MEIGVTELQAQHLVPAAQRCRDLEGEIAAAKVERKALLEAVDYDDSKIHRADDRVCALERELDRWRERRTFLEGRVTAQAGGTVQW